MLLYTAKTLVTMQQFAVLEGWMVTVSILWHLIIQPMSYILLKSTVTYGVFFFMIKFNKHPCILSSYISKSFSCCWQFKNRIT